MQSEQFADLKQKVEENGTARVEGMTKVVTDENVKKIISEYINYKFIYICMTKLTYGKILKEGYFANLDIGGILILIGISMVFIQVRAIKNTDIHWQSRLTKNVISRKLFGLMILGYI